MNRRLWHEVAWLGGATVGSSVGLERRRGHAFIERISRFVAESRK
ncbi:MAG: hypothetical protein OXB92_16410 [Acidimicrobiaceae bacterium]|nr:hypothetical protein [Acidimicrobiaceae bacterium]